MTDFHAPAVATDRPVLLPQVTPTEAKDAMRQYLELCESVLGPEDYQEFTERGKTKKFKKKSAVKKLQTFFGVEVSCPEAVRDDLGDGHFGFRVLARAQAKGGRVVESWGACSTHEERFTPKPYENESEARYAERSRKMLARSYHDVLATAETRATNRAVMNLIGVGGGEVTADEISRPAGQESRFSGHSERPAPESEPAPAEVPVEMAKLVELHAKSKMTMTLGAWLSKDIAPGLKPGDKLSKAQGAQALAALQQLAKLRESFDARQARAQEVVES